MKINKYFPFALIFFFVNSLGLPMGLTYTSLLCPVFYFWALPKLKFEPVLPFVAALSPFILIHFINGVDKTSYLLTLINCICIYVFCVAAHLYFKSQTDLALIFKKILYINFILCLIAIAFYTSPYFSRLWIDQFLTKGFDNYRRLRMFTYEASHYATLFVPLFVFFFLQIIFRQNKIAGFPLLIMITLPLLLSFSLGVITGILIALIFTYLVYFRTLTSRRRIFNAVLGLLIIGSLAICLLLLFYPDNTLFIRIVNIFSGDDSSSKGRTFEAFFLAEKISELKSTAFGIGLGQIKIVGSGIIRNYYNYDDNYIITIPNAAAETQAIFGWVGLAIRILVEIGLFFYTRVWRNYYRLALFIFVFIYQFTGSFITNYAEYLIWILAFTRVFPEFNVKTKRIT